ncbi:MAG: hypothetical protein ACT4QG_05685 [Sporichthyaceae bacterium]
MDGDAFALRLDVPAHLRETFTDRRRHRELPSGSVDVTTPESPHRVHLARDAGGAWRLRPLRDGDSASNGAGLGG